MTAPDPPQNLEPAERRGRPTPGRPPGQEAEDDDYMRQLLARTLRRDGCDVIEARNGAELTERIAAFLHPPGGGRGIDLIVTDVRMPWTSGLSVLAALRHHDQSIPVIVITAFGDEATHAEAARLGAAAVLDKPFELHELSRAVRGLTPPAERGAGG